MSRYNDSLLQPIVLLIALGLIMVYSASVNPYAGNVSGLITLGKQFNWLIIGSIFLCVCSFVNYRKLIDISKPLLFFSIFMAILGYLTKPQGADTARWLILFGKSIFQTSELVKIALIIFTASFIDSNKRKISDSKFMLKNYYPYLLAAIMVVFFQPDLSSSIMISGIAISMLFIAGMDKKQIKILFMILISAFIFKFLLIPNISGSKNYQDERFSGFINGDVPQQYHAINSIADGGFLGVGFGESKWKGDYVAEPQTDFIYSVTTSELGFLGLIILSGGFLMILIRGINIVKESNDLFGMFLAMGITFNFIFYFIIHVGYNIGIFPTTGLPLPFVSYGGSHTLFNLSQIGLLLSISYKAKNEK